MRIRWFPLILLCLLVSSCTHSQPSPLNEKIQTKPPDIPSPVAFQADTEKKAIRDTQDLYSFSLREADVKDILRAIARQTDYNVVIAPDVKGVATVDLKQVTLPKALEYILEPLGYSFKIEDRTIYVTKPKIETKIFYLNYIAFKKKATSTVTWRSGGEVSQQGGSTPAGAYNETTQEKAIAIVSESESDIFKHLEDNLKNILSAEGRYMVNRQAFFIMVSDYPDRVNRVKTLIEAMEGVIHKQVMIEAKIIEVILSDSFQAGVNWQLVQASIGSFAKISASQNIVPIPTPSTPVFRFFVGSNESGQLDIANTFIDILSKQGEIKVVSNPKIQTLNNQRAVIKDTRQLVYFNSQQSGGGVDANAIATYTTQFMNTGIILDVLPQIDENRNIVLSIHPSYSLLDGYEPNPAGGRVPLISTRETDTVVKLKDGETVIIGGLIYETKNNTSQGIPGLKDVPLLGPLFRFNSEENTRRELVIFLTPKIINP